MAQTKFAFKKVQHGRHVARNIAAAVEALLRSHDLLDTVGSDLTTARVSLAGHRGWTKDQQVESLETARVALAEVSKGLTKVGKTVETRTQANAVESAKELLESARMALTATRQFAKDRPEKVEPEPQPEEDLDKPDDFLML